MSKEKKELALESAIDSVLTGYKQIEEIVKDLDRLPLDSMMLSVCIDNDMGYSTFDSINSLLKEGNKRGYRILLEALCRLNRIHIPKNSKERASNVTRLHLLPEINLKINGYSGKLVKTETSFQIIFSEDILQKELVLCQREKILRTCYIGNITVSALKYKQVIAERYNVTFILEDLFYDTCREMYNEIEDAAERIFSKYY